MYAVYYPGEEAEFDTDIFKTFEDAKDACDEAARRDCPDTGESVIAGQIYEIKLVGTVRAQQEINIQYEEEVG